ncbi:MAG TPA: hypothetical protein VFZ97_10180 [Acidimicrobiales bacterium]
MFDPTMREPGSVAELVVRCVEAEGVTHVTRATGSSASVSDQARA